jgi:osmotically-inducible protein OsmY
MLALTAAVTVTASCATQPPQPPQSGLARVEPGASDVAVANAVYRTLNDDPLYYFRHVDVWVDDDGVAHLSGYVWSTDAIYRARTLATRVPGVTGVVTSQLELERNGLNSSGVAR